MSLGVETMRQATPEKTVLYQGVETLAKLFQENSRKDEKVFNFRVTEEDFPKVEALEKKLRQIRQEEEYQASQNHKMIEYGRLLLLKDKKFEEKMWVMPLKVAGGMTAHIGEERVTTVSEDTEMGKRLFDYSANYKAGDEFQYLVEKNDYSAELAWEILAII